MAEPIDEREIEDPEDSHVEIRAFTVGPIETNCYALVSDGHAMVVDPGFCGAGIAGQLSDVAVDLVVATHGDVPFAIGAGDAERAMHAGGVGSLGIPYDDDAPEPSRLLREGDTVTVGSVTMAVIETPGHTEGGVILLGDGIAFTGDTVFKGTVGRTDLVGGDPEVMGETLERLKGLIPPETVLLPGHGEATTMADELRDNPYLNGRASR